MRRAFYWFLNGANMKNSIVKNTDRNGKKLGLWEKSKYYWNQKKQKQDDWIFKKNTCKSKNNAMFELRIRKR